jgi:hypothetical protein
LKKLRLRPSAVRELAPKDPGAKWYATHTWCAIVRGIKAGNRPWPGVELATEICRDLPLIIAFVIRQFRPRPKPVLSERTKEILARISAELEFEALPEIDPRTKLFGQLEKAVEAIARVL